ncbi:MAG: hypothetical protein KDK28_12265 [Maritimibacter sp.]|nr:hypothetical protein [Maritimibacter sp.]
MVRISFLIAALLAALPAATALAQSADCESFKVNAKLLNLRNEPNVFGSIVDVLRDEQIVCIGEITNNSGQQWGNVVAKSEADGSATEAVDGWSNMRYLTPAAMATAPSGPTPTPTPSEPPEEPVDTADTGDAATPAPTPTTAPGNVPAFNEPWTEGAFPLNGRSLEQLSNAIPLFAPIEGLPEEVWKKPCTGCHQWNKDRLCEQAQNYIADPAKIFRIQHPHGGIVKNALFQWASAGCE